MRLCPALLILAATASADPIPSGPERLTQLWEENGSRREFLEALRLSKLAGDRNGAVQAFEACIAWSDGRALEAAEFAALAAAAPRFDLGDRPAAVAAVQSGSGTPAYPLRERAFADLVDFLLAWGEEWEWRGKPAKSRSAWEAAAVLSRRFEDGASSIERALHWANAGYRARHRLVGLALREENAQELAAQGALAAESHAARTALAAAPEPATREERLSVIASGYRACIPLRVEPPDHAVAALLDSRDLFSARTPSPLTLVALENRIKDRSLPLRYDAALALLPHSRAIQDAAGTWAQSAAEPAVGWALVTAAGTRVAVPEDRLDDPWAARACRDENALERAFERLPKGRRVAVAFRLMDLRGEDEVDLGR